MNSLIPCSSNQVRGGNGDSAGVIRQTVVVMRHAGPVTVSHDISNDKIEFLHHGRMQHGNFEVGAMFANETIPKSLAR